MPGGGKVGSRPTVFPLSAEKKVVNVLPVTVSMFPVCVAAFAAVVGMIGLVVSIGTPLTVTVTVTKSVMVTVVVSLSTAELTVAGVEETVLTPPC